MSSVPGCLGLVLLEEHLLVEERHGTHADRLAGLEASGHEALVGLYREVL